MCPEVPEAIRRGLLAFGAYRVVRAYSRGWFTEMYRSPSLRRHTAVQANARLSGSLGDEPQRVGGENEAERVARAAVAAPPLSLGALAGVAMRPQAGFPARRPDGATRPRAMRSEWRDGAGALADKHCRWGKEERACCICGHPNTEGILVPSHA